MCSWIANSLHGHPNFNQSKDPYLSINSMRELLDLYNVQTEHIAHNTKEINSTGEISDTQNMATSGGFQQYLIRKQMQGSDIDEIQPIKGLGSSTTTFHDLPVSLSIYIK